jgi:DNA-directed RNA polymerase sigma subunit (sigma70/sigma32)
MWTTKPSLARCEQNVLTLQGIASMLNLTKERIRQIEERALKKIKRTLIAQYIPPSDLFEGM